MLSIRKFRRTRLTAEDLLEREMLDEATFLGLRAAVGSRATILISGGPGTGKTTLLNALAAYLEPGERIVLIEDTAEIVIESQNLVRLEARRAQPDVPAVTMGELVKASLRLRPDRLILGEIRGAEAFDLLQALNLGQMGSLSTLHANSPRMALSRMRTCVAMAGTGLPDAVVARMIADVIQVVVQIERRSGVRRVTAVCDVGAYDAARDEYALTAW